MEDENTKKIFQECFDAIYTPYIQKQTQRVEKAISTGGDFSNIIEVCSHRLNSFKEIDLIELIQKEVLDNWYAVVAYTAELEKNKGLSDECKVCLNIENDTTIF